MKKYDRSKLAVILAGTGKNHVCLEKSDINLPRNCSIGKNKFKDLMRQSCDLKLFTHSAAAQIWIGQTCVVIKTEILCIFSYFFWHLSFQNTIFLLFPLFEAMKVIFDYVFFCFHSKSCSTVNKSIEKITVCPRENRIVFYFLEGQSPS